MKLIKNTNLILQDKVIKGAVLFSDKIEDIICDSINDSESNDDKDCHKKIAGNEIENIEKYIIAAEKKALGAGDELEVIDGENCYLAPGFIDIHIHGSAGYDTMDASDQALNAISDSLIKSGVTSFLPTTMSMPAEKIQEALARIKHVMMEENSKDSMKKTGRQNGARILGCHLEGPFLNSDYKGAQAAENIIGADIDLIREYTDIIKIVTIAPETTGAESFVKYLKSKGIVASVGHSGASYDDVITARQWGLSHVTHLFNAMTKFHHRKPGIIGAALATDLSLELIADFIHIHPAVLKIVLNAKAAEKIILITDQMRAGSLSEGEYELGGQKVIVKDGSARLENGQLAGSVLSLDQAVRNIKSISNLELYKIINMVTYNPACLLGMENEIGNIRVGNRADFVLLDKALGIINVYKDGECQ